MCFLFTDSISQYNDACPYDLQTLPGKMGLESQQSETNEYSCCPRPLCPLPRWPSNAGFCLLQKPCELLTFTLGMEITFYKTFNWSHVLARETFLRNSAHMSPMCLGKPQLESNVGIHTHVPMLPYKTSGYPPNDSVGRQQFIMETVLLSNLSLSVFVSLRISS